MAVRNWVYGVSAAALSLSAFAAATPASAQSIEEIEVTARHLPPAPSELVYATTTISRLQLDTSGESRLDGVLKTVPGFGLFRRQSSRAAHPTTQGITLRGLGPSGAGRTLLLVDGVPQNDPFGGWIDWSRMQAAAIDSTIITRGGGAGPWGNTALAGVINIRTRAEEDSRAWGELRGDSLSSYEGTVSAQHSLGTVQLFGTVNGHDSEGPYTIRKDQRGPVDRRAANKGAWAQGGMRIDLGNGTLLTTSAGYSDDRYVNGIDIQVSETQIFNANAGLVHYLGDDRVSWETHVYYREQKFSTMFSSIDDARTTSTPALDQFNVPATSYGANGILRLPFVDGLTIDLGADVRYVEGATNERFFVQNNKFSRVRHAGGEQVVTGVFVEANWDAMPYLTLTAGARVDYWRQWNGVRQENEIVGGAELRNDMLPSRDGTVENFRIGARSEVTDTLALKAVGYSGFRVPTINELYRPFRVGNDITEANPNLEPERMWGVEGGVEWASTSQLAVSGTVFHVWLNDAVSNITIATTPGFNAELGVFVPGGGTLRQRRNLDRIEVDGFEAEAIWAVTEQIELAFRYLYTNPKVKRSTDEPTLAGNRLAQVARHQGTLSAVWRPDDRWTVKAEGRAVSGQYDDDQNLRRLSGYAVFDLYADMAVTDYATLFVSAENIFDKTIEAGISADGLVSVGLPRVVAGGIRMKF